MKLLSESDSLPSKLGLQSSLGVPLDDQSSMSSVDDEENDHQVLS